MLLAIDVGNTHSVFGVHYDGRWVGIWRHATNPATTEDELAGWLHSLFTVEGLPWDVSEVICASVAPAMNPVLEWLCEKWIKAPLTFLQTGEQVGLTVLYDPPKAVGADRIANALGALQIFEPPLMVVDFGTGTTIDVVDPQGRYIGGAILPGILVSSDALFSRAAKLPHIEPLKFRAPDKAVGGNTLQSLQSGIMFGYAGAIDALVMRMKAEVSQDARTISTGGLGKMFLGLCKTVERFEPNLTLDGLLVARDRIATSR